MNAETAIPVESSKPRWRRRLSVWARRDAWVLPVEVGAAVALIATARMPIDSQLRFDPPSRISRCASGKYFARRARTKSTV